MKIPGVQPYYERDGIVIYHGDCRELLPLIPPNSIDLVLTDPPYGAQTHKGAQTQSDGRTRRLLDFSSITLEDLAQILDLANPHRWAVLTSDWQHAFRLRESCKRLELVRLGVWVKPDGCPQFTGDRPSMGWECVAILHNKMTPKRWNGGGQSAVWIHNVFRGNLHPVQKPLELFRSWIELFAEAGEQILDPFLGSGTTLVAAQQLDRQGIGIEIEERYCEIAAKRLEAAERGITVKELEAGQRTLFEREIADE